MLASLISCVFATVASIALFVHGLFIQAGIQPSAHAPIVLFGLSLGLSVVASYCGWQVQNRLVANAARFNAGRPRR